MDVHLPLNPEFDNFCNFKPKQCNAKQCWCVEPLTGQLMSDDPVGKNANCQGQCCLKQYVFVTQQFDARVSVSSNNMYQSHNSLITQDSKAFDDCCHLLQLCHPPDVNKIGYAVLHDDDEAPPLLLGLSAFTLFFMVSHTRGKLYLLPSLLSPKDLVSKEYVVGPVYKIKSEEYEAMYEINSSLKLRFNEH